jgi:hypothetical protein
MPLSPRAMLAVERGEWPVSGFEVSPNGGSVPIHGHLVAEIRQTRTLAESAWKRYRWTRHIASSVEKCAFKHPHDMPPFRFAPSPTFSSMRLLKLLGFSKMTFLKNYVTSIRYSSL